MVIKIPPKVNKAMEILRAKGHTAYVVGGAVRDSLLGVESQDWDIATSALPAQTVDAFDGYRVIETGIKHGTVTVLMDGTPLEITTYRIESGYSDKRHPDSVVFTDRIADDLARRDLTVNAIAYSPEAGFVDPYGGIEDIKAVYAEKYNGPVVTCGDESQGGFLSASALSGTDGMKICVYGNEERILLTAIYDNLGKGASGAALECMNLVLGKEKNYGLSIKRR